jgi:nitrogen fixation NifU-like protein
VSADPYQDALLALAREATATGRLAAPASSATRDNPLCGDRVTFDVQVTAGRVAAVAHRVRGCVLCQASVAYLQHAAVGRTRSEIADARRWIAARLAEGSPLPAHAWPGLSVFEPVATVKSRHGCVLLAFDALDDALAGTEA